MHRGGLAGAALGWPCAADTRHIRWSTWLLSPSEQTSSLLSSQEGSLHSAQPRHRSAALCQRRTISALRCANAAPSARSPSRCWRPRTPTAAGWFASSCWARATRPCCTPSTWPSTGWACHASCCGGRGTCCWCASQRQSSSPFPRCGRQRSLRSMPACSQRFLARRWGQALLRAPAQRACLLAAVPGSAPLRLIGAADFQPTFPPVCRCWSPP